MDGALRIAFTLEMLISLGLLKLISVSLTPKSERSEMIKFAITPLPAVSSWRNSPFTTTELLRESLRSGLFYTAALVIAVFGYWQIVAAIQPTPLALSYLAILPALLGGMALGPWLQIIYSITGRIIPTHHRTPLLSKSVSEFWGVHWNIWFSDWFRQVIFFPLKRHLIWASLSVFAFSGIWHEIMIILPAKLILGIQSLGSMLIYFLLQWAGMVIERKLLKPGVLQRIFTWIVVAGPAPLMLNEPMLRIFFLWPGK